jgi:glyoxylate carboligase
MSEMTAMDAAVSILYDEGVRCIFGIPGAGILPFYQSLRNFGKIIPCNGTGHGPMGVSGSFQNNA